MLIVRVGQNTVIHSDLHKPSSEGFFAKEILTVIRIRTCLHAAYSLEVPPAHYLYNMAILKRRLLFISLAVILLIGASGCLIGYSLYTKVMLPNTAMAEPAHIYVHTSDQLDEILQQLSDQHILRDMNSFSWWAQRQGMGDNLKHGHYLIQPGMSNREIVNLIMSGRQTPVNVTFNNLRTKNDLAGRIAQQLEPDSATLLAFWDTTSLFRALGLTQDNYMTIFLPNTYEFYWTTSAHAFTERMINEYQRFWTADRVNKASEIGLTPTQVYILASIVYSENEKHVDEAPRIAGVYMHRINTGMKLEADPTVKFAIGNFAIRRLLFADLEIDSPYNTYKYAGLPPGPIHMPPVAYIDAVLNYEKHDYIFMCASGDGSGYHLFAKTLAEHNRNRDIYIQTLNKQGIRR